MKAAALMCKYPLEEFLGKVKKYEESLGPGKNIGSKTRGLERKVRWGLTMKGEVQKLRAYLNVHMGSINMLLMAQGLEVLSRREKSIGSLQPAILAVPSANSVHTRAATSAGVEKKNLGSR